MFALEKQFLIYGFIFGMVRQINTQTSLWLCWLFFHGSGYGADEETFDLLSLCFLFCQRGAISYFKLNGKA